MVGDYPATNQSNNKFRNSTVDVWFPELAIKNHYPFLNELAPLMHRWCTSEGLAKAHRYWLEAWSEFPEGWEPLSQRRPYQKSPFFDTAPRHKVSKPCRFDTGNLVHLGCTLSGNMVAG